MLGRKNYTPEEVEQAKTTIGRQVSAYRKLAEAIDDSADAGARSSLEAFEPLFFNNLTLTLDRFFVHRIRSAAGQDGNPLNEVELVSESLLTNGGVLQGSNVIKLVPEQSVLKLEVGDRIALSAADFDRLSNAFFSELESRFL
jgi:hypothetical protein